MADRIPELSGSDQNMKTILVIECLTIIELGYHKLYNNQINARALIDQSAVGYCAGKPTEKSCAF